MSSSNGYVAVRLLDSPLGRGMSPHGWISEPPPETIEVAFHRDARGAWEFTTAVGFYGHTPQPDLWEVVAYNRVASGFSPRWGNEVHYRMVDQSAPGEAR